MTRPGQPPAAVVRAWAAAGELLDLAPTDELILLDIAERAGSRGMSWESAASLATTWRRHYRTVRRSLDRIEATGIVTVEHRSGLSSLFSFMHHEAVVEWVTLSTTPRHMARGKAEVDPAPYGANPAPYGAQPRAKWRDEPREPEEPGGAGVCTVCRGFGWFGFDEDTRSWRQCDCANASRRRRARP